MADGDYSVAIGTNADATSTSSAVFGFNYPAGCVDNGPQTVSICAQNGLYVNGDLVVTSRRALSDDTERFDDVEARTEALEGMVSAQKDYIAALESRLDEQEETLASVISFLQRQIE